MKLVWIRVPEGFPWSSNFDSIVNTNRKGAIFKSHEDMTEAREVREAVYIGKLREARSLI
jgi:hypothetical protein